MKNTSMLLTLVLLVVFAGYSEAGIISETYDEASEETTVLYEVVEWDILWNIYKKVISTNVTMEAVEKEIMNPNNITEPRSLSIGKVLVIKFKGKNLNAGNFPKEKPAIAMENPKTEKMSDIDGVSVSIGEGAPSVATINHLDDYRSISDVAKSSEPIEDVAGKEDVVNDLTNSLQAAKAKIAELEEVITYKDKEILLLKSEVDGIKNGVADGIGGNYSQRENKEGILKHYQEIAFKFYSENRALLISLAVFVVLASIIIFVYVCLPKGDKKYYLDVEKRILAATSQVSLKI